MAKDIIVTKSNRKPSLIGQNGRVPTQTTGKYFQGMLLAFANLDSISGIAAERSSDAEVRQEVSRHVSHCGALSLKKRKRGRMRRHKFASL